METKKRKMTAIVSILQLGYQLSNTAVHPSQRIKALK